MMPTLCDGVQGNEGGEDTRVRTGAAVERAPPAGWNGAGVVATGTRDVAVVVLGWVGRYVRSDSSQGGGQRHALSAANKEGF